MILTGMYETVVFSSARALKRSDVFALSLNGVFFFFIHLYLCTHTRIILNTRRTHLWLLHATHKRTYLYIFTRRRVHNWKRLEVQTHPLPSWCREKCIHTLLYHRLTISIVFALVKYIKMDNQTIQISRRYLSFVINIIVIVALKTLEPSSIHLFVSERIQKTTENSCGVAWFLIVLFKR